jgi:hypothetical protein
VAVLRPAGVQRVTLALTLKKTRLAKVRRNSRRQGRFGEA